LGQADGGTAAVGMSAAGMKKAVSFSYRPEKIVFFAYSPRTSCVGQGIPPHQAVRVVVHFNLMPAAVSRKHFTFSWSCTSSPRDSGPGQHRILVQKFKMLSSRRVIYRTERDCEKNVEISATFHTFNCPQF